MIQYIDKAAVVAEIEKTINEPYPKHDQQCDWEDGYCSGLYKALSIIEDTLEVKDVDLEQPEPYFYCKYGGVIPLCSDCKRNHRNSSFKTKEITTWFAPSKSSKYCIDYIQQEQKKLDIEEIIEQTYHDRSVTDTADIDHVSYENISTYFFELGLAQSSSDEVKIGESQIYLNDDGGEPPYDGKQWLDLSCTEYEIPSDKFKDGDKIEFVIRKIKKGK